MVAESAWGVVASLLGCHCPGNTRRGPSASALGDLPGFFSQEACAGTGASQHSLPRGQYGRKTNVQLAAAPVPSPFSHPPLPQPSPHYR